MALNKATPSAFAEWVFHQTKWRRFQYSESEEVEERREKQKLLGILDHHKIQEIKKRHADEFIGSSDDYEVVHTDEDTTLVATSLQIERQPMRGRPDLVLANKRKRHLIIVERKTTRQERIIEQAETQRGNWRNIQAQLWCYSYFDPWAAEANITLIGEIWRISAGWPCPAIKPLVWRKHDEEHETFCRRLFERYSNSFESE